MLPTPPEAAPQWESPDVSAFRAFLATETGRKLFPVLAAQRPLLSGQSIESTALRGKLAEGFERCCAALMQLAYPAREQQGDSPSAYPPLDDDAAWAQK